MKERMTLPAKNKQPAQERTERLLRFDKRREELTASRAKAPPSKGVVILSLDKFPAGPNPFVSTAAEPQPDKA